MINPRTEKLEFERAVGEEKLRVYEGHIKPFIDAKKQDLFESFNQVSVTDANALLTIRLHSLALDSIEADFMHYIETGKLASFELKEMKDE